jgi:hypothetical protein
VVEGRGWGTRAPRLPPSSSRILPTSPGTSPIPGSERCDVARALPGVAKPATTGPGLVNPAASGEAPGVPAPLLGRSTTPDKSSTFPLLPFTKEDDVDGFAASRADAPALGVRRGTKKTSTVGPADAAVADGGGCGSIFAGTAAGGAAENDDGETASMGLVLLIDRRGFKRIKGVCKFIDINNTETYVK